MRGGFYIKLAVSGLGKNKKLYLPYILTCICMVMMFYIIVFLAGSSGIRKLPGGDSLQTMLGLGVFVIAIFSLIFLYYTNSFLIRRRQKEFGLYHILGMGKRSLVKILIWENILSGGASILLGLLCGVLFSRLAELAAAKIVSGKIGFGFTIEPRAFIWTVGLFAAIFFLIMLRMLVHIYRSRPVEMLRSENVGEKPPKANWILAAAGLLILAGAYYLAVTIEDPLTALMLFFVAVVMVIIATYLLFVAGSVALCRLLQKNKKYYYRTKHFVSLSSMVYRMKRNGAGLASICILSTMVLVTVSSTVCLYASTENSLNRRYPRNITAEIYSMDEQNYVEPVRQEIAGGRVQISGRMTTIEATDTALLLRAGSLAAPMEIVEERLIGPSLGADNIEAGFRSTLYGFGFVAVFMILYYQVFGIVTAISLMCNVMCLVALLSMLQATLTLPGIAAIALTLGMAVDSNVLINERIREELRIGRTPQLAISEGYGMAFATIVDSNVTSLIAGIALLIFGSGPVRGFAVVHCLGIMTSLFTSVIVSRSMVNFIYGRQKKLTRVHIGQIWRPDTAQTQSK